MCTKIAAGLILLSMSALSGCTAIAIVDAAASTVVGVGKVAVKGVTATTGALIPDGEKDKKKDQVIGSIEE